MPNLDEVVIIDVSRWQGLMNWEKAWPLKIDAAYIKATDGASWVDPQFARNKAEVTRLGIPWGAYHFMRGDQDGRKQAQHFVKQIAHFDRVSGRWIVECSQRPAVDIEHRGLMKTRNGMLKTAVDFIHEFKVMTGIDLVIYTGLGFWNANMPPNTGLGKYHLWLAQYNAYAKEPTLPADWKTWMMWQWSADGNLRGPEFGATGSQSIDINRFKGGREAFYKEYPALAPGHQPPPVAPPIEPPDDRSEEEDDDMRKETITVYVVQAPLNVRNEIIPSRRWGATAGRSYKYSSVSMTLPKGSEVEALEEIKDGKNIWVRVGQRQYCAKEYDGNVYLA